MNERIQHTSHSHCLESAPHTSNFSDDWDARTLTRQHEASTKYTRGRLNGGHFASKSGFSTEVPGLPLSWARRRKVHLSLRM